MINLTEILITILISIGLNTFEKKIEPKKYELYFDDGTNVYISINKSQKYFCPKHCTVRHYHETSTSTEYHINNYNLVSNKENYKTSLFLNGKVIDVIYLIHEKKNKNNEIIHSNKKKLELYKFLEDYYN